MKKSNLLALVVIAGVLAGLAAWTSKSRKPQQPQRVGKAVIPGLQVNDVRRIELSKQGQTVSLADTGEGWVAASLYNYPADFSKIRENLLALRDLKVGDVQRGAKLDAADTTLVDLQDQTGRSLASLRLGAVRNKPNSQFGFDVPDGRSVAANTDDTVFLVKDSLSAFDPDVKAWINPEIVTVAVADIKAIDLAGPSGSFTLDRSSGTLTLPGLAADETFDSSKAYGVESALSYLRFADLVDPGLSDEQTGIATGHTFTVTTTAGEIYTARIGTTAPGRTDRYLRLAVTAQPVSTNDVERASVTQKAADLNANLSRWLYLVSSWSADNMTRDHASFIKPPEPAEPTEPETLNPQP